MILEGRARVLFQVGKALSTADSLDDMLHTATKLIFEVVNAERSVLLLKDPQSGELSTRQAYHRTRGIVDAKDIPVSRTISNQVVNEKVSIITSDALQDPRFMQGLSIVQYNIRSALCVPLWEADRVYGLIYLDNLAKSYAFTKDDLELMTAIANLIAIRIKQEETAMRLRREETLRNNLSKYHSPDHVKLLMERGPRGRRARGHGRLHRRGGFDPHGRGKDPERSRLAPERVLRDGHEGDLRAQWSREQLHRR